MKKIFLVLFLSSYAIFGQNIIDPPALQLSIPYTDTTFYHVQSEKFVRGWNGHWISGKFGDALDVFHYETKGGFNDTYNYSHNIDMIQGFAGFVNSAWGDEPFCAPGFQFEPTIKVDSSVNFKPRYRDNVGSAFGFLSRKFGDTISYDSDTAHFHKLYFDKNKMGTSIDTLALSNSWPDYEFIYHPIQDNQLISSDKNGTSVMSNKKSRIKTFEVSKIFRNFGIKHYEKIPSNIDKRRAN